MRLVWVEVLARAEAPSIYGTFHIWCGLRYWLVPRRPTCWCIMHAIQPTHHAHALAFTCTPTSHIWQALERGDDVEAAALDAGTSKRGRLLAELQLAVQEERFSDAVELSSQLRTESARRMDVTQDEGSYDRYLDQDDWYAHSKIAHETQEDSFSPSHPSPTPQCHVAQVCAAAGERTGAPPRGSAREGTYLHTDPNRGHSPQRR